MRARSGQDPVLAPAMPCFASYRAAPSPMQTVSHGLPTAPQTSPYLQGSISWLWQDPHPRRRHPPCEFGRLQALHRDSRSRTTHDHFVHIHPPPLYRCRASPIPTSSLRGGLWLPIGCGLKPSPYTGRCGLSSQHPLSCCFIPFALVHQNSDQ